MAAGKKLTGLAGTGQSQFQVCQVRSFADMSGRLLRPKWIEITRLNQTEDIYNQLLTPEWLNARLSRLEPCTVTHAGGVPPIGQRTQTLLCASDRQTLNGLRKGSKALR